LSVIDEGPSKLFAMFHVI